MAKLFALSLLVVSTSLLLTRSAFGQTTAMSFDREPDAVLNTKHLSELPKDIISVPILKDLLTEDFVFYYRDAGADWLSFRGAMARLAFENRSDLPTRIVAWLLNGAAEIAFWKGQDGKLSEYVAVLDQTGVRELAQLFAKIVASDQQLKSQKVGEREIFELTLSTGKKIYFATSEQRLFVFTSPNLPLPDIGKGRDLAAKARAFFGANEDVSVFGPKLAGQEHTLLLASRYFMFGYQSFFAGLKSLRFDFSKSSGWATRVMTDGALRAADVKDWSQMPRGAALCLALPINAQRVGQVAKVEKWLAKAAGNAIACWYPDSKFYTPLIALRGDYSSLLKDPASLKTVFTNMIGSREASWVAGASPEEPAKLKYSDPLPVIQSQQRGLAFTREVGGRFGIYAAKESKNQAALGSKRFFRVKLLALNDALVFSPDDKLVDKALTTLEGKFPSMSASVGAAKAAPTFTLAPDALAKLAKASILDSLPGSQESIFRTAISRQFFPNLDLFAKRPLQSATLSGTSAWKSVEWATHASK